MSAQPERAGCILESTSGAPGRARPLTDEEFEQLADALERAVVPLMQTAADSLSQRPLLTARVKSGRGSAELEAEWSNLAVAGRLRVDIHTTFAILVARKPIFWYYDVYRGRRHQTASDRMACESERMLSFEDLTPFREAIDGFVSVLLTAIPADEPRPAAAARSFRNDSPAPLPVLPQ